MKVFENIKGFEGKVNFVDDNNVFVGYDMGLCCCEEFGWYIEDQLTEYTHDRPVGHVDFDADGYVFDREYFVKCRMRLLFEGAMVVFKLICEGSPNKYLHIYNSQNGYYDHGFEFKADDRVIEKGDL